MNFYLQGSYVLCVNVQSMLSVAEIYDIQLSMQLIAKL